MSSVATHCIRAAESTKDVDFVKTLIARCRENQELWAMSWPPVIVESEIEQAETLLAIDPNGQRVGFLFLRKPGAAWEISLVALVLESRGRSAFKAFVDFIIKYRLNSGGDASTAIIDLEVRADNQAAIQAYINCGFVAVGRRKRYYADGNDAILFRLERV